MSESNGPTLRTAATTGPAAPPVVPAVHEAYAFACLNCGYGWEQAYQIDHQVDTAGRLRTLYRANGVPVPSPLTKPSCPGCGGEHVRIMRAGRVAETIAHWHPHPAAGPGMMPEPVDPAHTPSRPRREHRLHLPFHLHLRRRHQG